MTSGRALSALQALHVQWERSTSVTVAVGGNHENMGTTCSVDKARPPGTHVSPSVPNAEGSPATEECLGAPGSDSLRESQTLSSEKRDCSQEKLTHPFITPSVVHSFTNSLIHSCTHSYIYLSSPDFFRVIVLGAALCLGNSAQKMTSFSLDSEWGGVGR